MGRVALWGAFGSKIGIYQQRFYNPKCTEWEYPYFTTHITKPRPAEKRRRRLTSWFELGDERFEMLLWENCKIQSKRCWQIIRKPSDYRRIARDAKPLSDARKCTTDFWSLPSFMTRIWPGHKIRGLTADKATLTGWNLCRVKNSIMHWRREWSLSYISTRQSWINSWDPSAASASRYGLVTPMSDRPDVTGILTDLGTGCPKPYKQPVFRADLFVTVNKKQIETFKNNIPSFGWVIRIVVMMASSQRISEWVARGVRVI